MSAITGLTKKSGYHKGKTFQHFPMLCCILILHTNTKKTYRASVWATPLFAQSLPPKVLRRLRFPLKPPSHFYIKIVQGAWLESHWHQEIVFVQASSSQTGFWECQWVEGKQYIAAQKSIVQHTFYDTAGFHDHMVYENLVMRLHPYNLTWK